MLTRVIEHRATGGSGCFDDVLERLALQRRVLVDEAIQRGYVGLVMLAVMQLQGFLAHLFGRKCVRGIRKRGKFESHGASSAVCSEAIPIDGSRP